MTGIGLGNFIGGYLVLKTWMEVVNIDLKTCNVFEDLAYDGSERKNRIHIVDHNMTRL